MSVGRLEVELPSKCRRVVLLNTKVGTQSITLGGHLFRMRVRMSWWRAMLSNAPLTSRNNTEVTNPSFQPAWMMFVMWTVASMLDRFMRPPYCPGSSHCLVSANSANLAATIRSEAFEMHRKSDIGRYAFGAV